MATGGAAGFSGLLLLICGRIQYRQLIIYYFLTQALPNCPTGTLKEKGLKGGRQRMEQNWLNAIQQQINGGMFGIQSPNSNTSKVDLGLAGKLSPVFRNRAASAMDGCHWQWNRVNSCKKLDSPSKAEKVRKKSQNKQTKSKSKTNLSSYHIVQELGTLKSEYNNIKVAYQELINSKLKQDEENKQISIQNKQLIQTNELLVKQNQRLKYKCTFIQKQVERIKKQSFKIIEIEQFKSQKLQQSLQQKQQAIKSMMQNFKLDKNVEVMAIPTNDTQIGHKQNDLNHLSSLHLESLTLSKDKTLTNSQFISISLTSMMENESQYRQQLSTRRNNASYLEVEKLKTEAEDKQNKVDESANKANKQNLSKAEQNAKKFRKQINKRLEVNIQERPKQGVSHARMPLDRKNSKMNKSSKSKLKRDDQVNEGRSSKKRSIPK